MIVVTVRAVTSSENREPLLQAMRATLAPTRKESGCITYRVYQDIENPNAFTYVEEWEDWDSIQTHLRTNHVAKLLSEVPHLVIETHDAKFHEVAETRSMEELLA